jgi:hypothetical protein
VINTSCRFRWVLCGVRVAVSPDWRCFLDSAAFPATLYSTCPTDLLPLLSPPCINATGSDTQVLRLQRQLHSAY